MIKSIITNIIINISPRNRKIIRNISKIRRYSNSFLKNRITISCTRMIIIIKTGRQRHSIMQDIILTIRRIIDLHMIRKNFKRLIKRSLFSCVNKILAKNSTKTPRRWRRRRPGRWNRCRYRCRCRIRNGTRKTNCITFLYRSNNKIIFIIINTISHIIRQIYTYITRRITINISSSKFQSMIKSNKSTIRTSRHSKRWHSISGNKLYNYFI